MAWFSWQIYIFLYFKANEDRTARVLMVLFMLEIHYSSGRNLGKQCLVLHLAVLLDKDGHKIGPYNLQPKAE